MTYSRILLTLLCICLLVGCGKEENEYYIEPDPTPKDSIYNSVTDDNEADNRNNNKNNGDKANTNNTGQDLMINGGLEKWIPLVSYDMPENWLCHNNYNVRKDHTIIYEGKWSAKMQSLEKGSTATIDQNIEITSGHKIRILFHYYIEQWKDKGARTYCYFRTRAAEVSNISADVLKDFYDKNTYLIIRGGGYGLSYLPHELNKWQTFDETIEVPPTANYFVFGINSYYGTTIYVDDCQVIDIVDEHP